MIVVVPATMRRRAFLGAVTAGTVGLAGCSFRWGPREAGEPDGTTDRGTPTPGDGTATETTATRTERTPTDAEVRPPTPDLGGSVVDLSGGPRRVAIRPLGLAHADRVRFRFGFTSVDGEGPANLGVEITNARDHRVILETDALPVLGRPVARRRGSDGPPLLFVPSEWNWIAEVEPPIERDGEGYWRLAETVDHGPDELYPERVRLDGGDVVRADCAVVGPPGATGRPTGRYAPPDAPVELTVWHSERPGPTVPSRFGDREVPSLGDGDARWYHLVGPETPVYVAPDAERATLPARARFALVNHSTDVVPVARWGLYKLVDGAFYEVRRSAPPGGARELLPGGREYHRLLAFADAPVANDVPEETVVGYLGGGTYGVVALGRGSEADPSGALVDLEGPPAEVRPEDDVTAERDGATVTVYDPERSEAPETATATLARTDDAERRLIAEQVMGRDRNRPLRNTLPFVGPDVDEVVLETTPGGAGISPSAASDRRRFRFRDAAYELVAERSPRN